MANKQVNELTEKSDVKDDDLIPAYDSEESGSEKLKKVTLSNLQMTRWYPFPSGDNDRPALIVRSTITTSMMDIGAPISAVRGVVSAADFIVTIIHNDDTPGGGPPYLYGLNKVGDAPDVTFSDPRDAAIILDCTDVATGTIVVEVWIVDTGSNFNYVEAAVIVQDNMGICPP